MKAALAHNAENGGSRMVIYKDARVLVPLCDIHEAMDAILTTSDRPYMICSVNRAIKKVYKSVMDGTASPEVAITLAQDIGIWFANEVVEGRETLAVN